MFSTLSKDVWLASCGGAIEPLIHKELWSETFGNALNDEHAPRSWLIIRQGSWSSEFILESELSLLEKTSAKFLRSDFFKEFLASSTEAQGAYKEAARRFEFEYQRTSDIHILDKWFDEYISAFRNLTLHYWGSQTEFLQQPESRLRELLSAAYDDEGDNLDALVTLTTPDEPSIIGEEAEAIRVLSEITFTREQLEEHARRFPWLFYGIFDLDEALKFVEKRIAFASSGTPERYSAIKVNQAEILGKVQNKEIMYLSKFFREIGLDRFRLKACWAGAPVTFLPLFQDIAQHIGTSVGNLMETYRADEIRNALIAGTGVPKESLAARRESYTLLLDRGIFSFHEGQESKVLIGRLLVQTKEVDELRGVCASRGSAEGSVRIVRLEGASEMNADWDAFQQGEIMVVTMTQPHMLPMMRKAGAIITDEGGITSHAAIMSRELHIPCVVGTRTATRVLRNGDHVKIHADRGIVEIVTKKR
jgi:phosphohistidine swiveling domain-containing protein